jgi:hypothetical protein
MVVVPDTTIAAEGGHFKLATNQLFVPPFYGSEVCSDAPTPENYSAYEHKGAQRVVVQMPNMKLYGILQLCPVEAGYQGPASRLYRIEVPNSFVEATEGGRVSVVFEAYPASGFFGWMKSKRHAWILWLSREPIPHR